VDSFRPFGILEFVRRIESENADAKARHRVDNSIIGPMLS
jgi:hypothetical protein